MLHRNRMAMFLALAMILARFPEPGFAQDPDNHLIKFYQEYISPVDGDRCAMYPSCSTYAAQAIKKHGPVLGWIMACDRLVRCGRDIKNIAPVITVDHENYYNDPVEANDFWWFQEPDKKQE